MYKVESREENGEGSAWLARLSAPVKVGNREENGEGSAWSLCSGLPSGVESREENGEGSAWLARSGAPRAAIPPCVPEEGGVIIEPRMDTNRE